MRPTPLETPDLQADPDRLARQLLDHYDRHGRDLPWRGISDLYAIWISEIMLQQTGVSVVIPYYTRFLERFPTVTSLADASLDAVLSLWQGLGYYRRARHLHTAARLIQTKHGGEFPEEVDQVTALPGVGPSTAHAILAIGREQRLPILDGNVKRVLSRLLAWPHPMGVSRHEKPLWTIADLLTPEQRPGDYAQAIMDLGATLCRRSRPQCERCPWSGACRAFACQSVESFPVK
ncbi:MAG: A/G-specific adenine glycosylase, partial [Magnetococcales bacterium]|nr:A/G-specific adenine glycosylase [Magnetococcales bacterium]